MKAIASFLRRLREDPAFREEVRRQVLTDDLLELPGEVRRLRAETEANFARAFRLIEENARQIAALTERMDRVEGQLQENARQIAENSRQIAQLAQVVRGHTETLSRHGVFIGAAVEVQARNFLTAHAAGRGLRLLRPFRFVAGPDWEIDGVTEAEGPGGRFWLFLEAKSRVDSADIRRFARLFRRPEVRAALRELGVLGRAEVWVFAPTLGWSAEDVARSEGVGLIEPEAGVLVEAVPFELA
ncbi:hypothetical protein HRbin11_00693 [bacterium HR11]|nr:hypothetical protein HRbin11_00693 [bacterium HR11]